MKQGTFSCGTYHIHMQWSSCHSCQRIIIYSATDFFSFLLFSLSVWNWCLLSGQKTQHHPIDNLWQWSFDPCNHPLSPACPNSIEVVGSLKNPFYAVRSSGYLVLGGAQILESSQFLNLELKPQV